METLRLPEWLSESRGEACPAGDRLRSQGFLEKNLSKFAGIIRDVIASDETASRDGALQRLEPKAKITGFLMLTLAAAISGKALFISLVFLVISTFSVYSLVGLLPLLKRCLPPFLFTAALALPIIFSFVTPGEKVIGASGIYITKQGLESASFLVLRATVMVSVVSLLMLTTRQTDFFKGLGRLVPGFFTTALFVTFRYLLLLIKVAEDATFARKSRTIDKTSVTEAQRWFASRAAFILNKSLCMAEDVHMAMLSRGFSGKVATHAGRMLGGVDYLWLGFCSFVLFLSFGF